MRDGAQHIISMATIVPKRCESHISNIARTSLAESKILFDKINIKFLDNLTLIIKNVCQLINRLILYIIIIM